MLSPWADFPRWLSCGPIGSRMSQTGRLRDAASQCQPTVGIRHLLYGKDHSPDSYPRVIALIFPYVDGPENHCFAKHSAEPANGPEHRQKQRADRVFSRPGHLAMTAGGDAHRRVASFLVIAIFSSCI